MSHSRPQFERLLAEALAHSRAGRPSEAATAYRAALQLVPGHAGALHNLGVVIAGQGQHRAALECFDAVLRVEPHYASAHYNRAVALEVIGRVPDAIVAFAQALKAEPGNYAAHRASAFALLSQGQRERALDHFARTYELRRGDDRTGMAARSLNQANRIKLQHDAEQFRYLATLGRDARRFEALARRYEQVASNFPMAPSALAESDFELLGESYNTAIHLADAPEIPSGALTARHDWGALAHQFESAAVGALSVDDLLSPAALASLRAHLLESTIWHDFTHIEGFVASYLEDGLACPLLLQIVDELRRALSGLLGPLTQAWAFKAVRPDAAIDAHADDGNISVNFWTTPTEANSNEGAGGLSICQVLPPADWTVQDYERDKTQASAFLEQHPEGILRIPYRENRAALFESRLVHRSDTPRFADRYPDHRINLTLVFGKNT